MHKSKLQIRLEKHRRREQRNKLIKTTITKTVKSSTVFVISTALIAYPLHFPKTSAYFTAKTESDPIKFEFKNVITNLNIDHDENGLAISVTDLPREFDSFDIEYIELLCESNTKVFYAPGESRNGNIDFFLTWEDIEGLFDDIDDDEDAVCVELIGKGTNDVNSFFLKGTSENKVINDISIKEEIGLVSALSDINQRVMFASDMKIENTTSIPEPRRNAVTLQYSVEDQDGKPIKGVHWSIEDDDLGVEINSRTGEVTIPPGLTEGSFTIKATYRNFLGRLISDSFTVCIENELEEFKVVTSIEIFGPYEIEIPEEGENFERYEAIVLDQESNVMTDETVTWSLKGNPSGVSIEADSGLLIITDEAKEGTITIIATSDSNISVYEEFYVDLLAPEIEIVEELEPEGLEEEELLELEEALREEEQEIDEGEEGYDDEIEDEEGNEEDDAQYDEAGNQGEGQNDEDNDDEDDVDNNDAQVDDEVDDDETVDEENEEETAEDDELDEDEDHDEKPVEENNNDEADGDVDEEIDDENGNIEEDYQDDEDKKQDEELEEDENDGDDGENEKDDEVDEHDDSSGKDNEEIDDEDGNLEEDDDEIDDGNDTDDDENNDQEGKEEDDDQSDTDEDGTDEGEGGNEEPANKPEDSLTNDGLDNKSGSEGDQSYTNNQENRSIVEEKITSANDYMKSSLEKASKAMGYIRLDAALTEDN